MQLWIPIGLIFGLPALLLGVGVFQMRTRNRRVRECVEQLGVKVIKLESLPRKWSDKPTKRFAVRCEFEPAYLRFLIGEYRRAGIELIADWSLNEWLDAEEQDGTAFSWKA
ncbi:MAG: hypothetical protein AAF333_12910 [Planctomycetota bacterium]